MKREKYHEEKASSLLLDREIIRRLLVYFVPYRGWIVLAVLGLVVAKGVEAALPLFLRRFVDRIVGEGFFTLGSFLMEIFGLILLLFFGFALDAMTIVIKSIIGQRAIFQLRQDVFKHIQNATSAFYTKTPVGRLISRTIHDVDKISQMFTESLVPLLGNFLLFFGIGLGIFLLDARVGLVLLLIIPLTWSLVHYFRHSVRRIYSLVRAILAAMNVFVQEHIAGAHIIRHFGLREREKRAFEEINQDYRRANSETSHYYSVFFSGIDILQGLALILLFFVLLRTTPAGSSFPAGTFFAYTLYTLMFFRPLWDLAERYNMLQAANAAAERLFLLLDEKGEPPDPPDALSLGPIERIALEDVWFAYEGTDWILRGLNLRLQKNESMALVGLTGAGKTTLLKLLLRFYDVGRGTIWVNGHAIQEYSRSSVRKQMSVVLQEPILFSDTLEANLSLYDPHLSIEVLERRLEGLPIGGLIETLPGGFRQPLGERGGLLSLGQQQLVSLGRAIVHHHSLLLLDEATANIDPKTEKSLRATLAKILPAATSLIIAHRLSTIQDVDQIAVLQEGIVVERGSHKALLEKKGIYEKLYRYQFL